MKRICLNFVFAIFAHASLAEEAVVKLSSTVSGNQELPKVMYILPWQQPGEAKLDYKLQDSFSDELFVPLDRDEFVRGMTYQALLQDTQEEAVLRSQDND